MNVALLLAGGSGVRLGADIPKQYLTVNGKMVITHCLDRICQHSMIDAVQIVAAEEWEKIILSECLSTEKIRGISCPGKNRQLSILNGLCDIAKYAAPEDTVLIHDAARPCVSDDLIAECFVKIKGHDGVIPVLPMTDTVYYSTNGRSVEKLLERKNIFAGQAPESFRLGKYMEANKRLLPDKILSINGSTEPAVLAELDIVMISGDSSNFKITTREDLAKYIELLKRKEDNESLGAL